MGAVHLRQAGHLAKLVLPPADDPESATETDMPPGPPLSLREPRPRRIPKPSTAAAMSRPGPALSRGSDRPAAGPGSARWPASAGSTGPWRPPAHFGAWPGRRRTPGWRGSAPGKPRARHGRKAKVGDRRGAGGREFEGQGRAIQARGRSACGSLTRPSGPWRHRRPRQEAERMSARSPRRRSEDCGCRTGGQTRPDRLHGADLEPAVCQIEGPHADGLRHGRALRPALAKGPSWPAGCRWVAASTASVRSFAFRGLEMPCIRTGMDAQKWTASGPAASRTATRNSVSGRLSRSPARRVDGAGGRHRAPGSAGGRPTSCRQFRAWPARFGEGVGTRNHREGMVRKVPAADFVRLPASSHRRKATRRAVLPQRLSSPDMMRSMATDSHCASRRNSRGPPAWVRMSARTSCRHSMPRSAKVVIPSTVPLSTQIISPQ